MLLLANSAASAQVAAGEAQPTTCILKPRVTVQLGSPISGILSETLVDRGDSVVTGQIVARLESSVEQATLALDRLHAANDSAIKGEQVDRDLSIREAARKKTLVERGIDNQNALDELETKVRRGDTHVQQAVSDRQVAVLTADRSERTLALKQVRSPIDGVVIERKLFAGEYVYDQNFIMTIAQIDPLNVEVVLPLERYGVIRAGSRAVVHPAPPVGGAFPAIVEVVDPVIDAASGTFGVRLRLPNASRAIPAGIPCTVDWNGDGEVGQ